MTRLSNWREESDLFEVVTGKMTDEKALKKVDEKKGIKNKVTINPKLTEAIKNMGGELISIKEQEEEEDKGEDQKKKQVEQKQKRAQMIKKQVLMKKLIAVRQGSEDIVAHHEPDGDLIDEAKVDEKLPEYKRATARDKRYGNPHGSHALGGGIRKDRRADHEAKRGVKEHHQKDANGKVIEHEDTTPSSVEEAKVDKGRSDYGKASIRNYRRKGPGHGEPAMFDSENKRGKLIDKRREEHKARRGVKGAKVPAYKVEEGVKGEDNVMRKIATQDRAVGKDKRLSKKEGEKNVANMMRKIKMSPGYTNEATDAQLKSQEKAVFELEKKEANTNRANAMKKRKDEISEGSDKKGKGSGTKDACYHKVKSRYSVWPSAYASGALVKCRKKGAANWGNSSKKESYSWRDDFEFVQEGAAWTKKEGQNKEGGLNEKGRKSYERDNPGSDLKAPSKKVGNKRRASFCARMKGMRKRQKPSNNTGDDRLSKSLRAWNC